MPNKVLQLAQTKQRFGLPVKHGVRQLTQPMADTPKIRSLCSHEWLVYRHLRLRSLRDAPDSFGSTFVEEECWPESVWSDRLDSASDRRWDLPLVAEVESIAVGLAWVRIEKANPERADLYQMWVSPDSRKIGVGRRLLGEAISWAQKVGATVLILGVTCGNSLANRLYSRAGFKTAGEPQLLRPDSTILAQEMCLELRETAA